MTLPIDLKPNNVRIGHCIYCGAITDLTREHVFPYSLGGTWVLQDASCRTCAGITKKFEELVSRKMLHGHRTLFRYPTRRPKDRPTHIPIGTIKGGRILEHHVPVDESPLVPVALPIFRLPLLLETPPGRDDMQVWIGACDPTNEAYKRKRDVLLKSGDRALAFKYDVDPFAVMKLVAKLAHCAAMASFGDRIRSPFLPQYILGEKKDIRRVVGSLRDASISGDSETTIWTLEYLICELGTHGFLCAKIEIMRQLYAGVGIRGTVLPPYIAVIAEADQEMRHSVRPGTNI